MNSIQLPSPPDYALTLSHELSKIIKNKIHQHEKISFAEFMATALYHPSLGYYCNELIKFGAEGDFITAPEISPLFSNCVANQCVEIMAQLPAANILECGAGMGTMAKDILLHLEKLQQLPVYYLIIEISSALKNLQREFLKQHIPHLMNIVQWIEKPPTDFVGVILGNEILDALPVNIFQIEGRKVWEKCVVLTAEQFAWSLAPPSSLAVKEALNHLDKKINITKMEEGYTSEINLGLSTWLQQISQSLKQGLVLLVDYGYPQHEFYNASRSQGTLMCHYKHHLHSDPFWFPGLQDITAHVDFTAVAEAATQNNLQIAGFTNQANFLLNCGLMELLTQQTVSLSIKEQLMQSQQLQKLLMPQEMGEIIKVIALTRNLDLDLIGFSNGDQLHRL